MNYGDSPRVLVIEDNLDTQANLRDILEMDGYQVEVATTVAETLQPREWTTLFAIILDRRLPDGSADSLLPLIRERSPRAAVIVVTGNADLDGALGVIRHGIADFIPKPIDPDMLRASLARTAHLREMEEQSRRDERLATIGRMMASVAHESRNALQRITAAADLLDQTTADDPDSQRDVGNIRSAAGDLHSLLEEIRGYAAPIHLNSNDVDVVEIIKRAWNEVSHLHDRATIEITPCQVSSVCYVDQFRIRQVFRNLIENAISASSGASSAATNITVSMSNITRRGQTFFKITIADDGPGLQVSETEQLFEPFYTTKPEGTGLGLAIVRRIIHAHGGHVFVQPSDVGASFGIEIPREMAAQ